MRYFTYLLALLAGTALSLESAFLGEMGVVVGELESSLYAFAMGAVIVGQLAISMLIEHFGWLGSRVVRLTREKVLAVACMIAALLLIY